MNRLPALGILILLLACEIHPAAERPVAAAHTLGQRYATQKLQIHAAGDDCLILIIRTKTALDNTTVESIHYGTGEHRAYDGGIQQFAEDRGFRAVAYKDAEGGLWTYGAITRDEAKSMPICR